MKELRGKKTELSTVLEINVFCFMGIATEKKKKDAEHGVLVLAS